MKLRIIITKQPMPTIRMPRRNPNKKRSLTEMPNHPAPAKPGSAEHDDGALVHGRHGSNSLAYVGAASIIQITWTASRATGVHALQQFARMLSRDIDAVRNAIAEPRSSGQAEAQINRLKTLERAMFGRAGIELLRARMLPIQ